MTISTSGSNSCCCFFPITSSTRYFVDPGSTSPATRLIAINPNPTKSIARRGWISAQISGSELQHEVETLGRRFWALPCDLADRKAATGGLGACSWPIGPVSSDQGSHAGEHAGRLGAVDQHREARLRLDARGIERVAGDPRDV